MQQTASPSPRGVGRILATGADVDTFLQGQLTQDVRKVDAFPPLLAGYCSAKGRLLAVMQLQRSADGVVLEMHRSILEATLKRLRMFVLRSKVVLTEMAPAVPESGEEEWRSDRIARGIPTIYPETSDHFVPQMCNLDALGAISFDKGCYTGQEIVARLHYLGQVKRRMFRGRVPNVAVPGMAVFDARTPSQAVGEVVDAIGGFGLLVLQTSHADGDLCLGSASGPRIDEVTDLSAAA